MQSCSFGQKSGIQYVVENTHHHTKMAHCLVKVHILVGREALYAQDFSTSDHRRASLPPTYRTVMIKITQKHSKSYF